jgi:cell division transport system permease protein
MSRVAFLLGETGMTLRRSGWIGVVAILLTALSFITVGLFIWFARTLRSAEAHWRGQTRIVAYLEEGADAAALVAAVRGWPEVREARFVAKAEALDRLKGFLADRRELLGSMPSNPLPDSVELTVAAHAATREETQELAARLGRLRGVAEVQYTAEWIERLDRWGRALRGAGLGIGGFLALAAVLTVTTSATLASHARRRDLEVMRLVGAGEGMIRGPFLLQGAIQGILGALVALGVLVLASVMLAPRLLPLLSLTLGLESVTFLSLRDGAVLIAAGALLGGLGSFLAVGRGMRP